jgi:uncharacterized protein (DUF433 family)
MTLNFQDNRVPVQIDAHGVARVGGTRVTLDTLIAIFNQGATPEEIVIKFPTLALADIYTVIGYYLRYRTEIDAYLNEQEGEAEQLRQTIEAKQDMTALRNRLLARGNPQG